MILLPTSQNIMGRFCSEELMQLVVNLKQPTRAWKRTGGNSFSGCHWVIVTDLEAQEGKFVVYS